MRDCRFSRRPVLNDRKKIGILHARQHDKLENACLFLSFLRVAAPRGIPMFLSQPYENRQSRDAPQLYGWLELVAGPLYPCTNDSKRVEIVGQAAMG